MPVLANTAYTLADLRSALDGKGTLQDFINMLSQDNEILDDMLWIMANSKTKHVSSVLTGLPQAFWRMYNAGVPRSKSTRAIIEDATAMLETYSEVDKDLAALSGNSSAWRMQEDKAFVDGISQQMASQLIYGNNASNPAGFTGLAPRFSTVNTSMAANAVNVLDGGGQGSTNTSIWFVCWGANSVHGLFPENSEGGLQVRDVTTDAPVQDANGNYYQVLRTHFKWDCGMALKDWRYVIRIANIDTTSLTGSGAPNLLALMIAALEKMPALPRTMSGVQGATRAAGLPITAMQPVIYCNRTIRTALRLQILNKSNLLLNLGQEDGRPKLTFSEIPIRNVDAIINTEARVV